MQYRYQRFTSRVVLDELRAIGGALAPGDPLPRFTLPTTDGVVFDSAALRGRPALITFASYS